MIGAITGLGSLFVGDQLVYRLTRQAVMLGLKVGFRGSTSLIVFENSDDQSYFVDRHVVREEQTWLIPGAGVEVNEFFSARWEGERPVILCASRIIREKGILDLIQACRVLILRGFYFELWLAGDIDEGNPTSSTRYQLQAVEKEGLGK